MNEWTKRNSIWALLFLFWISVTDFPKRPAKGLCQVHVRCTETKNLRLAVGFILQPDLSIECNSSLQRGKSPLLNKQQDSRLHIWQSAHRALLSPRVWCMSLATGTEHAPRGPWTQTSNHGGSQGTLPSWGKLCWEHPLALDKESWSTPGLESCRLEVQKVCWELSVQKEKKTRWKHDAHDLLWFFCPSKNLLDRLYFSRQLMICLLPQRNTSILSLCRTAFLSPISFTPINLDGWRWG